METRAHSLPDRLNNLYDPCPRMTTYIKTEISCTPSLPLLPTTPHPPPRYTHAHTLRVFHYSWGNRKTIFFGKILYCTMISWPFLILTSCVLHFPPLNMTSWPHREKVLKAWTNSDSDKNRQSDAANFELSFSIKNCAIHN